MSASQHEEVPEALEAFVMAGGQSRRMGQNKALLSFGDDTMLGVILKTAALVAGRVRLVANDAELYAATGYEMLPDRWPGTGALGGIGTALTACETTHALVLACDIPLVTPELLRLLHERSRDADVVLPETQDRGMHPLSAVYSRACLPHIEAAIEAGTLKVSSFFESVRVERLTESELLNHGLDPGQLANLNHPAEYERFRNKRAKNHDQVQ